jgi:aminoglycoside phosphotransferase (APT) family kinase protein
VTQVLDWRQLGDLDRLLDGSEAVPLMRELGLPVVAVRPNYLRLKPRESALVGLEVDLPESNGLGSTVPVYARTFVDTERAAAVAEKIRSKRIVDSEFGSGVMSTPGGRTVLYVFPNDGELSGVHRVVRLSNCLRMVAEVRGLAPHHFSKSKSSLEVVRHRPERRVIVRLNLVEREGRRSPAAVYVRWFGDGRGAVGNYIAEALAAAGVPVAAPLGTSRDGRLSVELAAEGVDGTAALLDGYLDPDVIGTQLAQLQCVETTVSITQRRLTTDMRIATALDSLDTLALVEPELAGQACRLSLMLRRCSFENGPAVGIHGDFHPGQVVVSPGRAVFIDLERFALGDPITDVATMSAHVMACEAAGSGDVFATFLDPMRRAWRAGSGFDDRSFGVSLAAAVVDRALLGFRRFEPDWVNVAAVLLDQAVDALGQQRWHVVHPRPNGSWTASSGDSQIGFVLDDRRIEQRSVLTDPALPALRGVAATGDLRSYRPGRRAVVATEDGRTYTKVLRPKRAGSVLQRWEAAQRVLEEEATAPRIPHVLSGSRTAEGVLVLESLPGRPLHDHLVEGSAPGRREAVVASAVDILSRFHSAAIDRPNLPPAVDGGSLEEWLAVLERVHPGLVGEYRRVAVELTEPEDVGRRSLVHGDLHDRNVLLDGGRGGIIDLDALGVGDPALDVGNLAAHVFLRAAQRGDRIDIGRREAGVVLLNHPAGGLGGQIWGARSLFRLSILYRFRMRWGYLVPTLLRESTKWGDESFSLSPS